MRIAFSGAHRVGKTTLIEELAQHVTGYRLCPEPYALLEEDGHLFSQPPSLEDFVLQLQTSVELLQEGDARVLFDRCPADFLAYLATHPESSDEDLDEWRPRVTEAVRTLDLIVFVGIELVDRIVVPDDEEPVLRERVDEALRSLLLDDELGAEVDVLEVHGDLATRVKQVLQRLR